jgi:hypothetical protein
MLSQKLCEDPLFEKPHQVTSLDGGSGFVIFFITWVSADKRQRRSELESEKPGERWGKNL